MINDVKNVIFADLDGTLLDENYSCQTTKPLIARLSDMGSSIVLCSSKTRSEIEFYRKELDISNEPFIAENGSSIVIPNNHFPSNYSSIKTSKYDVISLGASYSFLREKLANIRLKTNSKIIGFGDMTTKELAKDTGLTLKLARLAKKRDHDEPFRIIQGNKAKIFSEIKNEGLKCTHGGRYFHLTGNTDKGKAVATLKKLYSQIFENIITFGIGDGINDLPMLKIVDIPFFIQKNCGKNRCQNALEKILQLINTKQTIYDQC